MDRQTLVRLTGQLGVFIAFFLFWEFLVRMTGMKAVILPPPSLVFATIYRQWPYLLMHTWPTAFAIIAGFLIAAASGFVIAIGIAYSRWVSQLVYPFLIVAQVLPKIAFAPLFLIWFGFGIAPKLVIAALIAFFPIVVNTARGLESVEPELIQYMRSLGASWTDIFFKISLPWAMPYILASFKISITLAVVGVVVGEFVASDTGLGYVIEYANIELNTPLMFAGIIVLSVLGVLFFLLIILLEYLLMSWHAETEATPETM
jgi:NitT/TauT family transport system permease protein